MDWVHLFTSFEGRITRQPFWIAVAIFVVLDIAVSSTIPDGRLSAALDLVLTYPQFAVCAKRGHDRNTPLWVVGLFFAISAIFDVLLLIGLATPGDLKDAPPTWAVVFAIPFLVLALALIIDLGFRRGTVGPNRYGPDPLEMNA
jgi:uncharacterized membrane protein YhaH (DUF805 family)